MRPFLETLKHPGSGPTATHHFCAWLHKRGWLKRVYTQNVDGLHTHSTVGLPEELVCEVHGALRDAGVLPQDPLVGFNEQTYRWVALSDWTYTTTLDVAGDRPAAGSWR